MRIVTRNDAAQFPARSGCRPGVFVAEIKSNEKGTASVRRSPIGISEKSPR